MFCTKISVVWEGRAPVSVAVLSGKNKRDARSTLAEVRAIPN